MGLGVGNFPLLRSSVWSVKSVKLRSDAVLIPIPILVQDNDTERTVSRFFQAAAKISPVQEQKRLFSLLLTTGTSHSFKVWMTTECRIKLSIVASRYERWNLVQLLELYITPSRRCKGMREYDSQETRVII